MSTLLSLAMAVLLAAEVAPAKGLSPGQIQMQDLAPLVGTWQNIQKESDVRSFEWINNKSYLMFKSGEYREIIGWDLVHERIVSWCFGTDGGQGTALWTREGEGWRCVSRGFLTRFGEAMKTNAFTLSMPAHDTLVITSVSRNADGGPEWSTTFKRKDSPAGEVAAAAMDEERVREIVQLCRERAWTISLNNEATPEDRSRASVLAQRAMDLQPNQGYRWLVAFAQIRDGKNDEARATIKESLSRGNESWIGQWLIAAMIEYQNGNLEAARDWCSAACDWMAKGPNTWEPNVRLRAEVKELLELPAEWPPGDWTAKDRLMLYDNLLTVNPSVGQLHHFRGSCYASLSKWEEALQDYDSAVRLEPEVWRHAEAQAAVRLNSVDVPEQTEVCRKLFDSFLASPNANTRMDVVLLCSLAKSADVNRAALNDMADGVLAQLASRPFLQLAKAMALYRLGRYDEAWKALPDENAEHTNPKDELLAALFRAMTCHQLGQRERAATLFADARALISEKLASPDGPSLPYQDRPVVWCMLQIALKEAALISSDGS